MMKLFLVCALMVVLTSAALPLPPNVPPSSPPGKVIAILRSDSDIAPDGSSYHYTYETENGISADETGTLIASQPEPALAAKGFFQFTSPEGVPVHISYIADENGYQPVGDVLPTPPPTLPVPPAILKALEYIAAHPEPTTTGVTKVASTLLG